MTTPNHPQPSDEPKDSKAEAKPEVETEAKPKTELQPATRRLYRSRTDRMIGGVAGGLAAYFDVDSSLMRLIFILLVLLPGIGIIAYIIAWIVIPDAPAAETEQTTPASHPDSGHTSRRTFGWLLVGLGLFFLIRPLLHFDWFANFWPLLLVMIGLAIIFGRRA